MCSIPDSPFDPPGSLPVPRTVDFRADPVGAAAALKRAVSEKYPLVLRNFYADFGWASPDAINDRFGHVPVEVLRKKVWVTEGGILKMGNNTSLQPDRAEMCPLGDLMSGDFLGKFGETPLLAAGQHAFEWKKKADWLMDTDSCNDGGERTDAKANTAGTNTGGHEGLSTSMDCHLIRMFNHMPRPPCKHNGDCPTYGDGTFRVQQPYFFFGMHYDCYDNVLVQLHGRKRIAFYRRESSKLTPFQLDALPHKRWRHDLGEVTLTAGDALWNPMGWFHAVETVGCEMSIFVNFATYWESDDEERSMARCGSLFARDYPLRQKDIENDRDYKGKDAQQGRR